MIVDVMADLLFGMAGYAPNINLLHSKIGHHINNHQSRNYQLYIKNIGVLPSYSLSGDKQLQKINPKMNLARFSKIAASLFVTAAAMLAATGCQQKHTPPATAVFLEKIKFDLSKIDENGLRGPSGGQTSVDFEFCIPAEKARWEAVLAIDPALKKNPGAGRVGCKSGQWCILGSTGGQGWRDRLTAIAKLGFVAEIQETFWE